MPKFTMAFTDRALAELQELAAASDKTIAQTIRDAVALERMARATVAAGGKVLVETANGTTREVLIR
jgi:hypothetical protein